MTVSAVTIAVAGLLIHRSRRLGYSPVGCYLYRLRDPLIRQLLFREHRWNDLSFDGRRGMEGRYLAGLSGPLGLGNDGGTQERN